MPLFESTSLCTFIPNYYSFPPFVRCLSGSRFSVSFLVNEGAWIIVASTILPLLIRMDTYRHLIPGAGISWVDRLDAKEATQQSATSAQPKQNVVEENNQEIVDSKWLPPRDSNPDMLIQSYCENMSSATI